MTFVYANVNLYMKIHVATMPRAKVATMPRGVFFTVEVNISEFTKQNPKMFIFKR